MARRQPAPQKSAPAPVRAGSKAKTSAANAKATKDAAHEASRRKRARQVIALIDEWLADESGYDEENWPKLKQALDEDRLSDRRFHE